MENSTQKRVLLVDDNPIDLMIHGKILEKAGVTDVDTVGSGQQALQYLDECVRTGSYPDLLLLDVNMPVMDGLEFLARYCGQPHWKPQSMKIILLTSSLDPRDRLRASSYGVDNYLEKPLRVDNLLRVLREQADPVHPH
jgi:CheY-like chemotaxis protein